MDRRERGPKSANASAAGTDDFGEGEYTVSDFRVRRGEDLRYFRLREKKHTAGF